MKKATLWLAAAVAVFAMAGPVGAAMTTNTIGANGVLHGGGANTKGTVIVTCTAGQLVQVTLTLTQGSVSGTGRGAARCTGAEQAIKVTVPARGATFVAGNAAACATAVNKAGGDVQATRNWCRSGGVTLS